MKRLVCFFLTLLSLSPFCYPQSKNRIAVTMDDLPLQRISSYSPDEYHSIFVSLIDQIKETGAPVTGFAVGLMLNTNGRPDKDKIKLLELWLDSGLELGNHSFSHKSANQIPPAEYKEDIVKGENAIKEIIASKGKELKFFRHPFLQTGRSLETRNDIYNFLQSRGYSIGFVTVDNSEWIFASAYEKAYKEKDDAMMKNIGAQYLSYMNRKLEYYEGRSEVLFGRNISHILLIHSNRLNSVYYSALCGMIKKRDYDFITLAEALKDEAYKSEDKFTGAGGISWIDRWAMAKGVKKDFFAGEPRCPEEIMKYAGIDSE